jgi:hypothetical protein
VEAVAAGDHVALELAARVAHESALGIDALHRRVEEQRQSTREARRDQILDDLRLAVDDDRAPAGEVAERDAVPLAVELERDAVVNEPLALEPPPDPGVTEQVDGAVLEHSRPDPRFAVRAAAGLQDHRLDAGVLQQTRQRQPGRACADDPDLRPQTAPSAARTSWAIANARLAAGTPQ